MWSEGSILIQKRVYRYIVKHFKVGSQYGILDNGKISKLFVTRDDMVVLNYDRGTWDTEAQDEGTELCLAVLVKKYN